MLKQLLDKVGLGHDPHEGAAPDYGNLDYHWMPSSGNRQFKANPRMIVGAEGNYLIDDRGRKIFDGLSGLWTCGMGHGQPKIVEAIARQAGQLDFSPTFQFGHPKAFEKNVELEYARNAERYDFLKWGSKSFENFSAVPPGTGICHQVNLEHIGKGVWESNDQSGAAVEYFLYWFPIYHDVRFNRDVVNDG